MGPHSGNYHWRGALGLQTKIQLVLHQQEEEGCRVLTFIDKGIKLAQGHLARKGLMGSFGFSRAITILVQINTQFSFQQL
jgi:hypothetical protein